MRLKRQPVLTQDKTLSLAIAVGLPDAMIENLGTAPQGCQPPNSMLLGCCSTRCQKGDLLYRLMHEQGKAPRVGRFEITSIVVN